jgi:hypothetical protein
MTRRTVFLAAVFSALSATITKPVRIKGWWTVRIKRRWEMAAHFGRSAESRKRSVVRWTELYERLERVEVDPGRREELRRDMAQIRLMAEQDAKRVEQYTRLAAIYRRAAFRPWQDLPPRPTLQS